MNLSKKEVQYTILFVDDEIKVLKSLSRTFKKEDYRVLTALSASKAWNILKSNIVNVIVTDHRMPQFSGVDLLKKVKSVYPDIIRIMLTGYADIDSVMEAVNQGAVYKFITKPWHDEEIKITIKLALAQYKLTTENKDLKKEKKEQIRNIDKLSKFINQSRMGELLVKQKLIENSDFKKAKAEQAKTGENMSFILTTMGVINENQIVDNMVKTLGIKKIDFDRISIQKSLATIIPKEICKSNMIAPVEKTRDILTVAMADPTDMMKIDAIKFLTGYTINPAAAAYSDIIQKIEELYIEETSPPPAAEALNFIESKESIVINIPPEDETPDFDKMLSKKELPSAVHLVNAIIADALNNEASDVHIEAKNRYIMVRYRISGLLHDKIHIPISLHPMIVSRIKVIAQLDIAERRRPQDGRLTVKTSSRLVDMRLSTLPTIAGEKIVFRILDRNSSIKDMEDLGMIDAQIDLVTQLIQKPQGCILVTGPTGSGKTSTLYSLIQKTATIQKNYTTIEDPVEYYMEKAEQVMIKESIGLTFPIVLRTLLRQDPDTIMLGEIRDFETAEVAFHAALTGHTVLSTLHTNSCVATITRLRDMGIQPHIISSALNGIIAQRLVRKICPNCMVEDKPSEDMIRLLGMESSLIKAAKKGEGCNQCENTGYSGRTGIYEVFDINTEMENLLQLNPTESEIKKAAVSNGMATLIESGFSKIILGITTCEEILRVLGPQSISGVKCPHCKRTLEERYNYCPHCATLIQKRCTGCSRALQPKWAACPDCGIKVKP